MSAKSDPKSDLTSCTHPALSHRHLPTHASINNPLVTFVMGLTIGANRQRLASLDFGISMPPLPVCMGVRVRVRL